MTNESSPCQMGAADPAYFGYMPRDEVVDSLNELLEAERAGAAAVRLVAQTLGDEHTGLRQQVVMIGRDEGRFCRMLLTELIRLNGRASAATGRFLAKVEALDGFTARMALLIKGQSWVVRRLDQLMPRLDDETLLERLRDMRDVHIGNVEACQTVLADYQATVDDGR